MPLFFIFLFQANLKVLYHQFFVWDRALSLALSETCAALYAVLKDDHLSFPGSQEEWKAVAHDHGEQWNFFHCLGAMDGRHFVIQPPPQ